MKKLGIMGGTFNPVHNGHIALAKAAFEEYELDSIMFLPNFQPPHKKCEAPAELRLEMTKAAVSDMKNFFVSDFEIAKGGVSYSVDTIKAFKSIYPETELYFIIGGDSLRDFHTWYKPDEIAQNCILLAYPRDDLSIAPYTERLDSMFGARVFELHAPQIDVSSSQIRELVHSGKSIEGLVPENVAEIIKKYNLYKG